jgi:hypothetical protein
MTIAAAQAADLGNLWILPGVYAPQADTYLLAQALHAEGITADMDVSTSAQEAARSLCWPRGWGPGCRRPTSPAGR